MKIEIKTFIYDDWHFSCNTYVVYDEMKKCLIIDPGIDDTNIIDFITSNNLDVKGILLTHGHFDHIRGLNLISKHFVCPLYIHESDISCLSDSTLNASYLDNCVFQTEVKPEIIHDGDVLKLLSKDITVIHTPFHTQGSVCFYVKEEGLLFSGDTLFRGSIGRFDFINSDFHSIKPSLNKLKNCL